MLRREREREGGREGGRGKARKERGPTRYGATNIIHFEHFIITPSEAPAHVHGDGTGCDMMNMASKDGQASFCT